MNKLAHIYIASLVIFLPTMVYAADNLISITNKRTIPIFVHITPKAQEVQYQPFFMIDKTSTYTQNIEFDGPVYIGITIESHPKDQEEIDIYSFSENKNIIFELRRTYQTMQNVYRSSYLKNLLTYGYIDRPKNNYSLVLKAKTVDDATRADIKYGTIMYVTEKDSKKLEQPILIPVEPPEKEPTEPPIKEPPPIEEPPEEPIVIELPPIKTPPIKEPPIEKPQLEPKTIAELEAEIKEIKSTIKSLESKYNRLTTKIGATKERYKDIFAANPRPDVNPYMNW